MTVLAIRECGQDTICVSCAMKNAQESGFPHLYFGANYAIKVSDEDTCKVCGKEYGSNENIVAAEQVLNLLKS